VLRASLSTLLVGLAFVGCGGNGDGLSKEEYAEKADAICRKYQERTDVGVRASSEAEAFVAAADRILAAFDDATRELRELEPPESQQELVDQWFAQQRVLRAHVERMRDRAEAGDLAGLRELAPLGLEHNRRANQLAERLGMRVCSSG
jgi:hypothetical protein